MATKTELKNAFRAQVAEFVMKALADAPFITEDVAVITKNGILVRGEEFDVVLTPVVKNERIDLEAELDELEFKANEAETRKAERARKAAEREVEKARKAAEREAKKLAREKAAAEAAE